MSKHILAIDSIVDIISDYMGNSITGNFSEGDITALAEAN